MASVLITAGPTREYLDAVRFLSNGSTGRMGFELARAALAAGHSVRLVCGPTELAPPDGAVVDRVESALEMAAAVDTAWPAADVFFGAAAVADERPAHRDPGKPAKPKAPRSIELVPNPDIIAGVAANAGQRAVFGFALEAAAPDAALERGWRKLARKGLDAIAVNAPIALGADQSQVVVLFADGREERLPQQGKNITARRLIELGVEVWRTKSG